MHLCDASSLIGCDLEKSLDLFAVSHVHLLLKGGGTQHRPHVRSILLDLPLTHIIFSPVDALLPKFCKGNTSIFLPKTFPLANGHGNRQHCWGVSRNPTSEVVPFHWSFIALSQNPARNYWGNELVPEITSHSRDLCPPWTQGFPSKSKSMADFLRVLGWSYQEAALDQTWAPRKSSQGPRNQRIDQCTTGSKSGHWTSHWAYWCQRVGRSFIANHAKY